MKQHCRITILVENTAMRSGLAVEHGLSFWIEYGDKRVLFDTGQSDVLVENAAMLGIPLGLADAIVLSHGHYDHTGGLSAVCSAAVDAPVYLHPAALNAKYGRKPAGTVYLGMSDAAKQTVQNSRCIQTGKPVEIFPGMFVTGQVPRVNDFEDVGGPFFLDSACEQPDEMADDQTLFFKSNDGLVVVFGCAHAGVVNILDYIQTLTGQDKIYAVVGGMHLLRAERHRMEKTIEAFLQYKIQKVIPLHCTGGEAVAAFRGAFGEKCLLMGAGGTIELE